VQHLLLAPWFKKRFRKTQRKINPLLSLTKGTAVCTGNGSSNETFDGLDKSSLVSQVQKLQV